MRLDYEAAEKAYRANRAEQARLHQTGGTAEGNLRNASHRNGLISPDNSSQQCVASKSGWHEQGEEIDR
jgi:hypothetical protein